MKSKSLIMVVVLIALMFASCKKEIKCRPKKLSTKELRDRKKELMECAINSKKILPVCKVKHYRATGCPSF